MNETNTPIKESHDGLIRQRAWALHYEGLISLRNWALQKNDYEMADAIKKELSDAGVLLKDQPEGTTWVKI